MKKAPCVYVVEDDSLLSLLVSQNLTKESYDVVTDSGIGDVLTRIREKGPDLLLLDVGLPNNSGLQVLEELSPDSNPMPVVMITADDSAQTAVRAMKLGAYDYMTKPFTIEKLLIVVRNALESSKLKKTLRYYQSDSLNSTIIGKSAAMVRIVEEIKKIAEHRQQKKIPNLLVLGESGTGKELVARAVHNASYVAMDPFVAINCAALPQGLLESELFGFEKGAFTDAKGQKKGLFEEADGGTLVLDEIGDMDISLQAKLLRVLENRCFRRIGGSKEIYFDVMIVATTNRDLNRLQKEGKFRADLFYRLSIFSLRIPPLRERRDDIPPLIDHFFAVYKKEFDRPSMKISPEALEVLKAYDWPGNVRELKSLFAKVCLFEDTDLILPSHVTDRLEIPVPHEGVSTLMESGLSLDEIEKKLLQEALNKTAGNMKKASQYLSISYETLRYRMRKYGIK